MLNYLAWVSDDKSATLTPDEVNTLFGFTMYKAQQGELNNGKYAGANVPLYWYRLKGGN